MMPSVLKEVMPGEKELQGTSANHVCDANNKVVKQLFAGDGVQEGCGKFLVRILIFDNVVIC